MNELERRTVCGIARLAGQEIMRTRQGALDVAYKADHSPVTAADKASDALIRESLSQAFPKIPILSEETAQAPFADRKSWKRFWLVDPLDGTKEFIKDNGEYAVCIALVDKGRPVFGAIQIPAEDRLYYGGPGLGAFRMDGSGEPRPIHARKPGPGETTVVLESRSHKDEALEAFLARYPDSVRRSVGSALKFCLLAEGAGHVYAKFGPTMEWDVAAGQALLEGAGGTFTDIDGKPFAYNKPSLRNGPFLAMA